MKKILYISLFVLGVLILYKGGLKKEEKKLSVREISTTRNKLILLQPDLKLKIVRLENPKTIVPNLTVDNTLTGAENTNEENVFDEINEQPVFETTQVANEIRRDEYQEIDHPIQLKKIQMPSLVVQNSSVYQELENAPE